MTVAEHSMTLKTSSFSTFCANILAGLTAPKDDMSSNQ